MEYQILAKGIALAGCAIGAGLALIAGIGPGIGEVTVLPLLVKLSAVSPSARVTLPAP